MTEMVYGTMPPRVGEPVLPRWWRTIDRWSLACMLLLIGIGLLLVLAASVPLAMKNEQVQYHYVQRQIVYGAAGILAMLGISMMSPDAVRRIGVLGFLLAFAALAMLPLFGTNFSKGAIRWYSLGFITVQPVEYLKPFFIILSAWLIAASQDVNGPPGRMISFVTAAVIVGVLAMQPDYGQAALVLFGWGVVYFVAGAPMLLIILILALAGAGSVFAYTVSEHVARRLNSFWAADHDATDQIGFAANAIREGGIFGVGVGEGQVKWSLPDAHTDFIIAVAAEEYGLILVLVIIALYAAVTLRSLSRLTKERDPFIRLAGTGLACIFAVQAMINLGVAAQVLPTKGMTLPFISYGGSSMVASGITAGMLLALTRVRPQGQLGDILFRRGR
jgi:cell division protein FtsW